MAVEPKPCESDDCGEPAVKVERFCSGCKKALKAEMQISGYLQSVPHRKGSHRTHEMKENVRETKYGRD